MTKTIILLIITYIFNLIDYWQTAYAISHFGLGVELNPLVRILFQLGCAGVVKLVVPAILLAILGYMVKIDKAGCMWAVYVLAALYFLLILHNFGIFAVMGLI